MKLTSHLVLMNLFIGNYLIICKAQAEPPVIEPRSLAPFEARMKAIESGKGPNSKIGGGNTAPEGAYPWLVSIGVKNVPHSIGHFCGGVVVGKNWVLTAAHCVTKQILQNGDLKNELVESSKIEVLIGSNYLSRSGHAVYVASVSVHPDYGEDIHHVPLNDLAILKLATAIDGPMSIDIVSQKDADAFLVNNDSKVLVAGWGRMSFGEDQPLSNSLQQAFVPIVLHGTCNGSSMYDGLVKDDMMCAGLGVTDACQGDSGGPAVAYIGGVPYLMGLVSWGVGCKDSKYPGVYVVVSKYRGWIISQEGSP